MATHTLPRSGLSPSKTKNTVLWVVQILAAVIFLVSGFNKLTGDPMMVGVFEAVGFGQWFRIFTGLVEIVGAILLLTPRYAAFGALLLIPVMFGAIVAHFFVIGGSPVTALLLLILMGTVAFGRREQYMRLRTRL